MQGFYFHPTFGPHEGDPIGGTESTALTASEYAAAVELWASEKAAAELAAMPLQELATRKLQEIRFRRREMEHGGVVLDEIRYESDPTARAKYVETNQLFLIQPTLEIPGWKASDDPATGLGVYVTMTAAVMANLIVLAAQLDGQAFAWEQGKQAEVAAALALENEADAKAALAAIPESM